MPDTNARRIFDNDGLGPFDDLMADHVRMGECEYVLEDGVRVPIDSWWVAHAVALHSSCRKLLNDYSPLLARQTEALKRADDRRVDYCKQFAEGHTQVELTELNKLDHEVMCEVAVYGYEVQQAIKRTMKVADSHLRRCHAEQTGALVRQAIDQAKNMEGNQKP